jgi:hypothetical protein
MHVHLSYARLKAAMGVFVCVRCTVFLDGCAPAYVFMYVCIGKSLYFSVYVAMRSCLCVHVCMCVFLYTSVQVSW